MWLRRDVEHLPTRNVLPIRNFMSDAIEKKQDKGDNQNGAEATGWIIAPILIVGPGRNGGDKCQNENGNQK